MPYVLEIIIFLLEIINETYKFKYQITNCLFESSFLFYAINSFLYSIIEIFTTTAMIKNTPLHILALILLSLTVSCQFNISIFNTYPNYTNSLGHYVSALRDSGKSLYVSIRDSSDYKYKVLKYNLEDPNNIYLELTYFQSSQTQRYGYLYFFQDYLIASAPSVKPVIFNLTSGAFICRINYSKAFGRGEYIQSSNQFFFGSQNGQYGYFNVSTIPSVSLTILGSHSSFTFLQRSLDLNYISVSFKDSGDILIYQISDWTLVTTITVSVAGVYTQGWSSDSRYIMVFKYNSTIIDIVDRDSGWIVINSIDIGHKQIRTCFYYPQTNVIVAYSQNSNKIITISLSDFTVMQIYTISSWKMYTDSSGQYLSMFNGNTSSNFFGIHPYCVDGTEFDQITKSCIQSTCYNTNACLNCLNSTTCTNCNTGYHLVNGTCIDCPDGEFYDYTTWTCIQSCEANCSACDSTTICIICQVQFYLDSGSCFECPSGTFYNYSSQACSNCPGNCSDCTSSGTCTSCFTNYVLLTGSCYQCGDGYVFNNSLCDSCPSNCRVCSQANVCFQCFTSYILDNSQCINSSLINEISQNKIFEIVMELTLDNDVLAFLNKVPGSRRIFRQIFAFFLNIDHLWLYIYHQRQYGYYVERVLTAVQNLQQQKWQLVSDNVLNNLMGVNISELEERMNQKIKYTSYKYIEIEGKSSSFLVNSLQYFLLNLPLVTGMFILFKLVFLILFKYELSLLFRQYAFNGYLLLMIIQGNSESFSYFFMYDCTALFQLKFTDKLWNILSLICFSLFIIQLIAGFFLIRSAYKNHSKYFYDNCSNSLKGSVYLLIQYGLLNFILGSAHIIMKDLYNEQLITLFIIETAFISFNVLCIRCFKIFDFIYIQWLISISSFLRICLIFTYSFDQYYPGQKEIIQSIQMYLLIIYLSLWMMSALIGYLILLVHLIKYLQGKLYSINNIKQDNISNFNIIVEDRNNIFNRICKSQKNNKDKSMWITQLDDDFQNDGQCQQKTIMIKNNHIEIIWNSPIKINNNNSISERKKFLERPYKTKNVQQYKDPYYSFDNKKKIKNKQKTRSPLENIPNYSKEKQTLHQKRSMKNSKSLQSKNQKFFNPSPQKNLKKQKLVNFSDQIEKDTQFNIQTKKIKFSKNKQESKKKKLQILKHVCLDNYPSYT